VFQVQTDKKKAEAVRETIETVETLEGLLLSADGQSKKPFFSGDNQGYVDVVLAGMIAWMQGTNALCGVELLDAAKTPLLLEWTERFAELDTTKLIMLDLDNLVEFAKDKRAKMMNQNQLSYVVYASIIIWWHACCLSNHHLLIQRIRKYYLGFKM
jgi:glutathione S-transferase